MSFPPASVTPTTERAQPVQGRTMTQLSVVSYSESFTKTEGLQSL